MANPEPNLVVKICRNGALRAYVDGKGIVGVTNIEVAGFRESKVTLEILGKFVRFEQESDAGR